MGEIERELGRRVRWMRRTRGMTQQAVAASCGVSFQQIQKYESASSRLSAGMLWRLSLVLKVDVEFFFHGLDRLPPAAEPRPAPSAERVAERPATREEVR